METLDKITDKAKKQYAKSTVAGKKVLEDLFGKDAFVGKITDRIKTFPDACKSCNIALPYFSKTETADEIAYKKLKIIVQALNEGWKPNWKDSDEYKYYPWWDLSSGFVLYYVYYDNSYSTVGSRLCFKNRELAEYAAKQFKDIYKEFLTI